MTARRRIAVVTGTRAEFGLLEPVLQAMTQTRSIEPQLIVTGTHLLPKFGHTIKHIQQAGWRVDARVRMQSGRDDARAEAEALGKGVSGIARALQRLDSEIVVVLGDRIEAFAAASAAAVGRRVLAHIHGGDRGVGDVDDSLRNAISRLAHVHLVASLEAERRLKRMGEAAWRIHRVGAPGLDDIRRMREEDTAPAEQWRKANLGPISARPYAVVVQHACGRSGRQEKTVMQNIVRAVERGGLSGVAVYPNSDPGHEGILSVIRKLEGRRDWRVFKSLPRREYLYLLTGAALQVGNSSSAIIESAAVGVNAVNIGPRQNGRLHCGPNVLDSGEGENAVLQAVRKALKKPRPRPGRGVYGDGRAGQNIVKVLKSLKIGPPLLRKETAY